MSSTSAPSPPDVTAPLSRFHWRHWWRNGWLSRVILFFAVIILLNLFQPWVPDMTTSGYTSHQTHGRYETVTTYSGITITGKENAFDKGQGWVPFLALVATLYVCGRPRSGLGGWRWVPLCAGLVCFAYAFDYVRAQDKEMTAYKTTFSTPPYITIPPAPTWTVIFSIPLIICGAFQARRVSGEKTPAAV